MNMITQDRCEIARSNGSVVTRSLILTITKQQPESPVATLSRYVFKSRTLLERVQIMREYAPSRTSTVLRNERLLGVETSHASLATFEDDLDNMSITRKSCNDCLSQTFLAISAGWFGSGIRLV